MHAKTNCPSEVKEQVEAPRDLGRRCDAYVTSQTGCGQNRSMSVFLLVNLEKFEILRPGIEYFEELRPEIENPCRDLHFGSGNFIIS